MVPGVRGRWCVEPGTCSWQAGESEVRESCRVGKGRSFQAHESEVIDALREVLLAAVFPFAVGVNRVVSLDAVVVVSEC